MNAKVALVTGGATGIGRATCLGLAERGVGTVVIGYSSSADAAAALAREVEVLGAIAHPLRIDVADRADVARAAAEVMGVSGGLDVLVNSAGVTQKIAFADLDAVTGELWDTLLNTNVVGAFWTCQAFAETLRARSGSIVNVSSIAAERAVGSSLPYGVSKAALSQLTRGLAVALAPSVRVNAVSPGTVMSGWHERLVGEDAARQNFEAEAKIVPLGRLGDSSDIADAIVSLALDMRFVTGEVLMVDGGKSLRY